jgi:hypothetical protein
VVVNEPPHALLINREVRKLLARVTGFTTAQLEEAIAKCFDAVPVSFIRKVANVSGRYVQLYREGATGRLAEFAARKYSSHRCVPDSWLSEVMADYKAEYNEEASSSMLTVPTKDELLTQAVPRSPDDESDTESESERESESESESEGGESESESEDDASPAVARQVKRWSAAIEAAEERSAEAAASSGKRARKVVTYNEKDLEQNWFH